MFALSLLAVGSVFLFWNCAPFCWFRGRLVGGGCGPCLGNRPPTEGCLCPALAGEACGPDVDENCDEDLGLRCVRPPLGSRAVCQGRFNLVAEKVEHHSVTLSWRDFKPENYLYEYIIFYSENLLLDLSEWKSESYGNLPTATVSGLRGNTVFFFRVATWMDPVNGTYADVSSTLIVHTKAGCPLDGRMLKVGEVYEVECEEKCVCSDDGSLKCDPVCPETVPPDITNPNFTCKRAEVDQDLCCPSKLVCRPRDGSCAYDSVHYANGSKFYTPCSVCLCLDGEVSCVNQQTCPELQPSSECPVPTKRESRKTCCPLWTCQQSCKWKERTYRDGDRWTEGCSRSCRCSGGSVFCTALCPVVDVGQRTCPRSTRRRIGGRCCEEIECTAADGYCVFNSRVYRAGDVLENDGCQRCACSPNGSVYCYPTTCSPAVRPEKPSAVCPKPEIRVEGCCPVVRCRDQINVNSSLVVDLTIIPESSTSVKVGFQLVGAGVWDSAVGYELHYTEYTRVTWARDFYNASSMTSSVSADGAPRKVFVRKDGLKRNTTYCMKIGVRVNWSAAARARRSKSTRAAGSEDPGINSEENLSNEIHLPSKKDSLSQVTCVTTLDSDSTCVMGRHIIKDGQKFKNSCREECTCQGFRLVCWKLCREQLTMVLPSSSCPRPKLETPPGSCCPLWRCYPQADGCLYKNVTMENGETLREGCSRSCTCTNGSVSCRPACVEEKKPNREGCVLVPFSDLCCKVWMCDPERRPVRSVSVRVQLKFYGVCTSSHDRLAAEEFTRAFINELEKNDLCPERTHRSLHVCGHGNVASTCHVNGSLSVSLNGTAQLDNKSNSVGRQVELLRSFLSRAVELVSHPDFLVNVSGKTYGPAATEPLGPSSFACDQGFIIDQSVCINSRVVDTSSPGVLNTSLTAVNVTCTSAILKWRKLTTDEREFVSALYIETRVQLERGGGWNRSEVLNSSSTEYLFAGLRSHQKYYARMLLITTRKSTKYIIIGPILFETKLNKTLSVSSEVAIEKIQAQTNSAVIRWKIASPEQLGEASGIKIWWRLSNSHLLAWSSLLPPTARSYTMTGLRASALYAVGVQVHLKNDTVIVSKKFYLKTQSDAGSGRTTHTDSVTAGAITGGVILVAVGLIILLWRRAVLKKPYISFENKTRGLREDCKERNNPTSLL